MKATIEQQLAERLYPIRVSHETRFNFKTFIRVYVGKLGIATLAKDDYATEKEISAFRIHAMNKAEQFRMKEVNRYYPSITRKALKLISLKIREVLKTLYTDKTKLL